ncbi:MAG: CoA ester lyase [Pseudomonadota bacterium]
MTTEPTPEPLRRSLLFVPANKPRALTKAQSLPTDGVVVDLEDAVADGDKAGVRAELAAMLADADFGHRELWVRINALDTRAGQDDLRAVARLSLTGVVLPKVDDPESVHRTGVLLGDAKRLMLMIETPRGVLAAAEALAAHAQVAAAMLGTQDLGAALRLPAWPVDRQPFLHAMQNTLLAARAAGVDAIDSVNPHFRDLTPLTAECAQARSWGYDGKAAIHPAQLGPINAAFSVSAAQQTEALSVIEHFEAALARGESVANRDGQMVEALHAEAARRTVLRAEREAARDGAG